MRPSRPRIVLLFSLAATLAVAGCGAAAVSPTSTFTPVAPAPSTSSPAVSQAIPAATPATSSLGPNTIDLTEWKVAVSSTIKAGKVTFTITNSGTVAHELLVFQSDLARSAYPLASSGDIIEDGSGIALISDGDNIDPAGSQTREIDLSVPGTYLFVCNIPGHYKAGMFQVVTVTP